MTEEQIAGIATLLGGIVSLVGREVWNAYRRQAGTVDDGGKLCKYGSENRDRIADVEARVRVLEAIIKDQQHQSDEIFMRLKDMEAVSNKILGFLSEKL